jgi:hypothetical protein
MEGRAFWMVSKLSNLAGLAHIDEGRQDPQNP